MAKSFATAAEAFDHLLDTFEAQPERTRSILAEPDYAGMDAEREQRFHEAAQLASESGAIGIDMRKRPDEHLIKALRLIDSEKLYAYTSRTPRVDQAKAAWAGAEASLRRTPEWLETERTQAILAWSQHRSWRGLEMSDAGEASLALVLAAALEDGASPGTPYRMFSAAHAGDSKALRRSELVVSGILRAFHGMDQAKEGEQPLAAFGIVSMPDPILIRGPFSAGDPPQSLAASRLYAAVTPPNVETIAWSGEAPYLITIENKASFIAYVTAIQDGGAVIFTGGFPSDPAITLMKRIAASRPEVPWFHWGDIDGGGLRIFRFLETEICRPHGIPLQPHLMTRDLAQTRGKPPRTRLSGLKRIADSDCALKDLAAWLSASGSAILEQELIDPVSPH